MIFSVRGNVRACDVSVVHALMIAVVGKQLVLARTEDTSFQTRDNVSELFEATKES